MPTKVGRKSTAYVDLGGMPFHALVEVGSYVQKVSKLTRALLRLHGHTRHMMPSLVENQLSVANK